MRPTFASLSLPLLLLTACGGSSGTTVPQDDRVPATPLPAEQASADGPTGNVTLLSVDGYVIALPSFREKAVDTRPGATTTTASCRFERGSDSAIEPREVSAGTVTFTIPTRDGDQTFDVVFNPARHSYELQSFEAQIEIGGLLKVSAAGDSVPAFDAEMKTAANVVFDVPDVLSLDAKTPADVPVRWHTEGENDDVLIDISIGDNSVTCFFDSSARSGTIPADLVTQLTADVRAECTPDTCRALMVSRRHRDVTAGDWRVVVMHGFATMRDVRVIR